VRDMIDGPAICCFGRWHKHHRVMVNRGEGIFHGYSWASGDIVAVVEINKVYFDGSVNTDSGGLSSGAAGSLENSASN
jgi:hypothetical protein